jgi:putative flippase GtrA
MILADGAGAPLWLAVAASFAIVAVTGYLLHARFSFRRAASPVGFGRYALGMSVNLPLCYATTWLFSEAAGLAMTLAAPLASLSMIVINYLLARWAILTPRTRTEPA